VLLSYCIALVVADLGIVIALLGATGSTTINYILPGAVYWRLYDGTGEDQGPAWKRTAAAGMFMLGCVIMPVCVGFIFI
jgi:hypothetical protein